MAINVKLKFSWGHIIAFLAMIFISYVSFMGLTYATGGSFIIAGIGVFVIDLLAFIFFIVPQFLKGTDVRFDRKIKWERAFIYLSIPVYIAIMLPFIHFWTVFDNRQEIEGGFAAAVTKTEDMFAGYETYSEDRIASYAVALDTLISRDSLVRTQLSRNNRLEAMRLQLIADNYTSLKKEAVDWVNKAKGVSVWNVFMIGNVDMVREAIDNWNVSLNAFTTKRMHYEYEDTESFTDAHPSVVAAKSQLEDLRGKFTSWGFPTILALLLLLLIYLMMIFPYLIQQRNTKSIYTLWGVREGVMPANSIIQTDSANGAKEKKTNKYSAIEF